MSESTGCVGTKCEVMVVDKDKPEDVVCVVCGKGTIRANNFDGKVGITNVCVNSKCVNFKRNAEVVYKGGVS